MSSSPLAWSLALGLAAAAADQPLLLQKPSLSKTHIVFAYAGDLWTVPRDGGDAVRLTRAHNNANILTLGAKYLNVQTAEAWTRVFLETPFEGGRHQRRVDKISQIEQR